MSIGAAYMLYELGFSCKLVLAPGSGEREEEGHQLRNIYKITALLFSCISSTVSAHEVITTKVTWTREISRIVFDRCISCHREGGTAFSLTTYAAARPWAKAIKEETLERRMPPFAAVKGFSDLKDDQSLTQEQLELISDWVEGGAPEGDPNLLPKNTDLTHASTSEPKLSSELIVDGDATLHQSATFAALRPKSLREGCTIQVVAQTPDGGVTPLIWIYKFNPKFERTYYFGEPLKFPAGTRIITSAKHNGVIALLGEPDAGGKSATLHENTKARR